MNVRGTLTATITYVYTYIHRIYAVLVRYTYIIDTRSVYPNISAQKRLTATLASILRSHTYIHTYIAYMLSS